MSKAYLRSPLYCAGNKHKLLPQIVPLFPKEIDGFVDIFGGGGNVLLNVKANHYHYNDVMPQTVGLFESLFLNPDFILEVEDVITKYNLSKENKEGFYALRSAYNENRTPDKLYALTLTSFSNQMRFNSNGEFNNSFGRRFPWATAQKNIIRAQDFAKKAKPIISNSSFNEAVALAVENANENDFVPFFYFDPPYLNTDTSYIKSGEVGWSEDQEQELRKMLVSLPYNWALSNDLAPNPSLEEWALKHNYTIHELDYSYSRSMAARSKDKPSTREVLITNY